MTAPGETGRQTTPHAVYMLRIVTFGEAMIWLGGERIAPTATRMFALALYLGAERGRDVPRTVLQALLFPESDERNGGHSLRQLVYRTRQLGAPLVSTPDAVSIATGAVEDDYSSLVASPALEHGQLDVIARGFMPGYAPVFSAAFGEWLDAFRGHTTLEIRRKALAAMADARGRCDWRGVAGAARACLALDPLNEDATIGLAESLAMTGSKVEALAQLDRFVEELPAAAQACRVAARQLRQRIASRVAEPAPVSLRDMPLVGREEEMRRLTAALAHTRTKGGGVVVISGEPGIGKTRLITEFERLAGLTGAQTARVVCRSSTAHQPLSPFIELTRALLQLPGALGCSPEALEVLRALCTYTRSRSELPESWAFDPASAFGATTAAILDLVDAVSCESMLVLLVDDTQWLDEASLEVVRLLLSRPSSFRALLVFSERDRRLSAEQTSESVCITRIRLGPISRSAASTMLRMTLGDASTAVDATGEEELLSCTSGNPLFIQLAALHFRIRGGRVEVPPFVSELLRDRVEGISESARSLLECCVVMGRNATMSRLETVLAMAPVPTIHALRELESMGLLDGTAGALATGHPLLSDLVMELMPSGVELLLHRRIATVLAAECDRGCDATLLWDCADHWERAGDVDNAAVVLRSCVLHSLAIGRPKEVYALLERMLQLNHPSISIQADSLRFAAAVYDVLGDWQRADALVNARLGMRTALGPDRDTHILRLHSRHATAVRDESGRDRALAVLEDHSCPSETRVRAAASLIAYAEDEFESSLAETTRRVIEGIDNPPHDTWLAQRYWLIYHTCFGDVDKAAELALDSSAHHLRTPPGAEHINRCHNLVYALARTGSLAVARQLAIITRAAVSDLDAPGQAVWCECWLAWLSCQEQKWDEAWKHSRDAEAAAAAASLRLPPMHAFNSVEIAIACNEPMHARATLDVLIADEPGPHSARKALHIAQLHNRTNRALGRIATDPELQHLERGHIKARGLGMHDDVTLALFHTLTEHGRGSDAAAYLRQYLGTFRRDPFPISPELAALAAADSGAEH